MKNSLGLRTSRLGEASRSGGRQAAKLQPKSPNFWVLHASVGTSAGTGRSLPRCRRESWRESTILSLSTITAGDSGAVVPE